VTPEITAWKVTGKKTVPGGMTADILGMSLGSTEAKARAFFDFLVSNTNESAKAGLCDPIRYHWEAEELTFERIQGGAK
jgi:hypothetical protein